MIDYRQKPTLCGLCFCIAILGVTLPCSTCERMSLARVTLRIDSPCPVHDTAPLRLSAYPPQPYLQRQTMKKKLKILFPQN